MQIATVVKSWVIALPARFIKSIRGDLIFRRLLVNSGWLLGSNTIITGIAFVQGILITRLLGVEQYGVLGIVMTFVGTAKQLTSFRMNEFIVKYTSDAFAQKRNDIAAATLKLGYLLEGVGSLLAFGIACVIAPYAAKWFVGSSSAAGYIYGYTAILLVGFIGETSDGVLQTFKQFRQLSLLITLGHAVTFIGVVIAFVNHTGIGGVLIAYFIGRAISSITLMASAWRLATDYIDRNWWKASLGCLREQRRVMLKFALYTNIGATLSLITKDSDALWLGYFRNPTEVGYYKLAMTLGALAMMPVAPFAQTIYPELTQALATGEVVKTKRLLKKSTAFAGIWVVLVVIGSALLSPFLIVHLYGSDFLPAAPVLLVLLVGLGFAQVFFWVRPGLLSLGRADIPMKINIFIAGLKIVLTLLIVPIWGYIGNAVVLTLLYIVGVSWGAMRLISMLRPTVTKG